jgi:hypothetical protein
MIIFRGNGPNVRGFIRIKTTTGLHKKKNLLIDEIKKVSYKSSSRSSSDRSVAEDTDSEVEVEEEEELDEKKDKLSTGVCLLKFKK